MRLSLAVLGGRLTPAARARASPRPAGLPVSLEVTSLAPSRVAGPAGRGDRHVDRDTRRVPGPVVQQAWGHWHVKCLAVKSDRRARDLSAEPRSFPSGTASAVDRAAIDKLVDSFCVLQVTSSLQGCQCHGHGYLAKLAKPS